MTDKAYPELPKAHLPRGGFPDLFTADQLAAAVAAERGKCAQVCDRLSVNQPWDYDASTRASAARDCAAAIRAGAPPDTLREAGAVAGGAA